MDRRKNELIQRLRQFKDKISKNHKIETVILFGSQLTTQTNEDSDIDLIIVGEEFRGKDVLQRAPFLYLEWDLDYPVDFLCYTPEEFEIKKKQIGIIKEAVEKGIEIFGETPIYPYFTGNPFVDAGIAALCALNQRNKPSQISKEDLANSADYILNLYPNWLGLRNLFTQNCTLLNPSHRKNREAKYRAEIKDLLQEIVPASATGDCAACGTRKANRLLYRERYPLTGSGDLLNYFSFFEPGFPICAACTFAVQFVPLYLISNDGLLFLAHSHNTRILLTLAKEAVTHFKGFSAVGANPTWYLPIQFSRNDINECVVKLARYIISKAEAQGLTTVRLYSFINSGQLNRLDFVDLPTEVFSFLERAYLKGLNKNLDELFDNANKNLYYRLVTEGSIRHFFLQLGKRRIIGGWELFELYLEEVEKMEKERLEIIKKVGQRLYQYLKTTNFKELKNIEIVDNYGELRMQLTKIQKKHLIWEIDDEVLLFPRDKEGAILWRETHSILLGFLYEQMHKNGINPEEV